MVSYAAYDTHISRSTEQPFHGGKMLVSEFEHVCCLDKGLVRFWMRPFTQ